MKRKSFQAYLEKRFNKDGIAAIEEQALREKNIIESLQHSISEAIDFYMEKNKIGFNELVRRLDSSPSHIAKIRRGEANLTLTSLAHIFALLEQEPRLFFKKK